MKRRSWGRVFIARKGKHHVPSPRLLRAVVVCIDAASTSGVATYVCGRLHYYRDVLTADGPTRRRVLADAATTALVRGLPLGGVIEVPFGGRLNAALSLSASVALWKDSWRTAAGTHSPAMVEHTAVEWRRPLFGARPMTRDAARELEHVLALQVATRDMPATKHYRISPDSAAAICIGQIAIRSAQLHSALECDLL